MQPTVVLGARQNNLKGVSLTLQPGTLTALTGVSGAGKSSLALDTLYAEGQRRFVESFSPYARQFLERLPRPAVDRLSPVPAAIAVARQAPIKSSRSTLATLADLEPFLAALFLREARPVCPEHNRLAVQLDADSAARQVLEGAPGQRACIAYRAPVAGVEQYLAFRDQLLTEGYRRLWVAGAAREIDTLPPSEAGGEAHVVLDRMRLTPSSQSRLSAALEQAFERGEGLAEVFTEGATEPSFRLRRGLSCPECARPLTATRRGLFSYESPIGACRECRGFGRTLGLDTHKVIPDPRKSLGAGAIRPWASKAATRERAQLRAFCRREGIPLDVPVMNLPKPQLALVWAGGAGFYGINGWFEWLAARTYKMHVRVLLARYRAYDLCGACQGQRLGPEALGYRVGGRNIGQWHTLEVAQARAELEALECTTGQGQLAQRELGSRLRYLERVGLGYLRLDRQSRTLSGGEAQRVTLTAALGTQLHNALFIVDEPSVGLHAVDLEPLAQLMNELCARNNSVLLIEHDAALISHCARVLELGPGAGERGGELTFDGSFQQAREHTNGACRALEHRPKLNPAPRRATERLVVRGARGNNLKNLEVEIPLGVLCAVCGPSGSGKSTLVGGIVYPALARRLGALDLDPPKAHTSIDGAAAVRYVEHVDQSPLSRTGRGNAATYTKAWDGIRKLFAGEAGALAQSLTASHFSFNVDIGRCSACKGEGFETVEMQFLADVRLRCPICQGKRFSKQTLGVYHRERTVADVLGMTVDEALAFFEKTPSVTRALRPLSALGLGYLPLGQPLSTLSGGEAQRLKLSRSLRQTRKGSLWIVDEPSAGLHPSETDRLIAVCRAQVEAGASVLLVEHDLSLIAQADWVIELGPGGGEAGGELVFCGTPEALATAETRTARALREAVVGHARSTPRRRSPASEPLPEPSAKGEGASLRVVGARQHNLKNVSTAIPHGQLTVVTGPSGSGKSSLAFDVIFAEGQRRFLETLSPYARQFVPSLPRPDVDRVTGVPPSVSLEQRTARAGAKSTVATVTEVAHFLRLFYAKLGTVHCPEHDRPLAAQGAERIAERLRAKPTHFDLCAPMVRARKGNHLEVFNAAARAGLAWAYADGRRVPTDNPPKLAKTREHSISVVVAECASGAELTQAQLALALRWGGGQVQVWQPRPAAAPAEELSEVGACPDCGFSDTDLDPRRFSFNTEQGRCPNCLGHGSLESTPKKKTQRRRRTSAATGSKPDALFDAPDSAARNQLCSACRGTRLAPVPRAVRFAGLRFDQACGLSVAEARRHFAAIELSGREAELGRELLSELNQRFGFLAQVGLAYLNLDRPAMSLSGGEMQRLRLSAQLGSGLTGALYVLDEPTIGLHPADTQKLLSNLRALVDLGSTIVVVEHDEETIAQADYLLDMGPVGGANGGHVVASGAPEMVLKHPDSPTAKALARVPALQPPGQAPSAWLELRGASENNLAGVDVRWPLERLSVVAGVSGSGKSTLVRRVLLPAVRQKLGLVSDPPGTHDSLRGGSLLRRAVSVDQSPIGRSPRSVPATFLGIWDAIRRLFASTTDAQVAGFEARRFSFNSSGGRCETCAGQGVITHEMSFLADVVETCPACEGKRFEPQTLGVRYRGLNIAEVLELPASQAALFFDNHPKVAAPLRTLEELGIGYVTLGQGSHTLSGGEAQRLKLSQELTARTRHEPTLYVLDEPTTGLHLADVERLMRVLRRLVERGDSLVVIEHHPWVMAGADWVVELGPGGGSEGGRLLAEAPPGQLSKLKTPTGLVLRELAERHARSENPLAAKSGR